MSLSQRGLGNATASLRRKRSTLRPHVHPAYDGSMHMMLPREDVHEVLEKGWGELHPMALKGLIPPNAVMIFGPRDEAEVDVVVQIIAASHRFALGT